MKAVWERIAKSLEHSTIRVFFGLTDRELPGYVRNKRDFLYADNSYYFRGPRNGNFRLIRGALHLTGLLPEQPGRVVQLPEMRPWKKVAPGTTRQKIVVIPPSPYHVAIYDAHDWLKTTLDTLSRVTSKPVYVKHDKREDLRACLSNALAMVTFSSVAGVEAALAGVPVFAGPLCPCHPISAGDLIEIERPFYADREIWRRSLAYANWSVDDVERINLKEYAYQCTS